MKPTGRWTRIAVILPVFLIGCDTSPSTIEAVAKLISAIAWPTIVIVLLVTQRKLFGRLENFKVTGTGIEAKIREGQDAEMQVVPRSRHPSEQPTERARPA